MATGGAASRLIGSASEPSVSTNTSLTILMTIWPGVIDLTMFAPIACALTLSIKLRTTSSATSASIRARRTSRMATLTSSSLSAPRRVRVSKIVESLELRLSNMRQIPFLQPAHKTKSARCEQRRFKSNAVSKPDVCCRTRKFKSTNSKTLCRVERLIRRGGGGVKYPNASSILILFCYQRHTVCLSVRCDAKRSTKGREEQLNRARAWMFPKNVA